RPLAPWEARAWARILGAARNVPGREPPGPPAGPETAGGSAPAPAAGAAHPAGAPRPPAAGAGARAQPPPPRGRGRKNPASRAARDPGPPPHNPWSHWHTQLTPPAERHAAETQATSPWQPREPFTSVLSDDTIARGMAAIKDGAS